MFECFSLSFQQNGLKVKEWSAGWEESRGEEKREAMSESEGV